jgi:hypothetical protein
MLSNFFAKDFTISFLDKPMPINESFIEILVFLFDLLNFDALMFLYLSTI